MGSQSPRIIRARNTGVNSGFFSVYHEQSSDGLLALLANLGLISKSSELWGSKLPTDPHLVQPRILSD